MKSARLYTEKQLASFSPDFWASRGSVEPILKERGTALKYVSHELRDDKDLVMLAVQNDWEAFEFASDDLRNDREVALMAIGGDGWAIQWASDALKDDFEVAMAAVLKSSGVFEYEISPRLRQDPNIRKAAEGASRKEIWEGTWGKSEETVLELKTVLQNAPKKRG